MRRWCLLILLTPCAAASKDLVISGSLERVMHQAITIKRPDGIIQFDDASTGYSAQYPFAESNREIVWDYIKIGDVSHLLPVSADDIARFSAGSLICVNLKYTNHRHFEAASSITFQ